MNSVTRTLRASSVVTVGQIAIQICGFARNVIVARMIAPAEFGIAAALVMCNSFVDMVSDMSTGRYLARADKNSELTMLGASHVIELLRGVLGAIAILLLGRPVAGLLGMREQAWAFQMLAIIPLVKGFAHNDGWRLQRKMDFIPSTIRDFSPQILTLLLAIPLAWWLHNFTVLLWLLIAMALMTTIASHVLSKVPYQVRLDPKTLRILVAFGAPLLIDGLMLFAVFNGERVIVAKHFGKTMLGLYSAAYLLTVTPTGFLANIALSLGLPQLASAEDVVHLRRLHQTMSELMLMASVLVVAPFALAGNSIMGLVYGRAYQISGPMIGMMGCIQGLRILRIAPTVTAMAKADTVAPMVANICRALSVGGGWIAAIRGAEICQIIGIGVAGEAFAVILCNLLLQRRHGLGIGVGVRCLCAFVLVFLCAQATSMTWLETVSGAMARVFVGAAGTIVAEVPILLIAPAVTRLVADIARAAAVRFHSRSLNQPVV